MIKVFISQPMHNRDKNEIIEERKMIIKRANAIFGKDNFTIIDSLFDETTLMSNNPMWDLGRSIQLLSTADVVMFAQDGCIQGDVVLSVCVQMNTIKKFILQMILIFNKGAKYDYQY